VRLRLRLLQCAPCVCDGSCLVVLPVIFMPTGKDVGVAKPDPQGGPSPNRHPTPIPYGSKPAVGACLTAPCFPQAVDKSLKLGGKAPGKAAVMFGEYCLPGAGLGCITHCYYIAGCSLLHRQN
jgi:hypothetical protein